MYGDWKTNLKSYEKVQGIVVDIKFLMKLSSRQNEEEIRVLADKIAKYVNEEVWQNENYYFKDFK